MRMTNNPEAFNRGPPPRLIELMRTFTIILSFIFIISCRTDWLTPDKIPYKNKDNTLNVYLIDSLSLNINLYQVVRSDRTGHTFIIPDYVWTASSFSEKRMFSDSSCFLLEWDLGYYLKQLSSPSLFLKTKFRLPEFDIWDRRSEKHKNRKNSYYPLYFKKQPDYYYLVLIRGDALNCMKHGNPTGFRFSKLKFGDEKCYYKVLFPVWKENGE